jgi:site-specific DNA-methyltransferase (adenine-specific)
LQASFGKDDGVIQREEVIGDCRLLLGDCREIMPTLVRVDAVVTDPPYGIGYVHGAEKGKFASKLLAPIIGDDKPFDPSPFLRFPCLMWGANHFAARLPGGGRWIVWDKRDGIGSNDHSDIEIGWISGPRRADRIISHLWNGWAKASERGVPRVHPTQKPISVMRWCLELMADAETILDPFMGSGTTLVACAKMGRKGIGIELDPGYFDSACRRVEQAYREPDLFVTPSQPKPVQESML